MKKRIRYTDEPMALGQRVKDFLPPPEKLILKEDGIKVTMILSKESYEYFRRVAKRQRQPYQRLIRVLLHKYAAAHPRP